VLNCPKCGSPRIHRSRSRNAWERLRKSFTNRRLHRCHACEWRGWGPVSSVSTAATGPSDHIRQTPNLQAIDVAVEQTTKRDEK
jgi:hypothetical protein